MMKYAILSSDSLNNCPEENDETVSEGSLSSTHSDTSASASPSTSTSSMADGHLYSCDPSQPSYAHYQPPLGLPSGYSPPAPFPSWADSCPSCLQPHKGAWPPPSFASGSYGGGYSNSLPFCPPPSGYPSFPGQDSYPYREPLSHNPSHSSLDLPRSLHSILPTVAVHKYFPPQPYPHPPQGRAYCAQCPVEGFRTGPTPHRNHRPGYILAYGHPAGPDHCRCPDVGSTQSEYHHEHPRQNTAPCRAPLSLEQRKVADCSEIITLGPEDGCWLWKSILKGLIDVFEQQFKSISKIDFMEKFINEKDYLIIIVISPKYYETVTGALVSLENDERTLNTVYIHKQLQNEFIQNGCRNFRFIPIVFPGAKKCHVPSWLQNTHVYSWPGDHDDILRRLMRVEKYNPPPIGELPTIVSIPL
ncbi:hypothetical protein AAFF_G00278230 [Aldrovandia affinis]|uniref:SEFIR domain-containing protein n=1 Tax=Aldrovandia affinis TaxID=143900 RepID=A0AAD7WT02_9TELE|nr:hypothetical protein AAFF_G00278230 [Aldrovandia affinis]